MSKRPLVSVVILNWNGLEDTLECLESLRLLSYKNFEVILVDNGSVDDSKKTLPPLLKSWFDKTTFIDLPKNTGFTGGHIAGFEASKGSIILLLNNDAVVQQNIIERALQVFDQDELIGVVGGRAFFWNENNEVYDEANQYYSYQTINPITAEATTLETGAEQCVANNVSGAGVFIKRALIDKVGYLNPRFFAYYEETDLFARAKRSGYKVIYSPDVKIWHKVGNSTKDKPFFYYYLIFKNQFLYAYNNFDSPFLRKFLGYYFYTFFFKALILYVLGRDRLINKARLKSFFWNVFHCIPTIRERQKLHKQLDGGYSYILIREKPQPISLIIDASGAEAQAIATTLESIRTQSVIPSEVVVAGDKDYVTKTKYPFRLHTVVDKKIFNRNAWDFGFICSNNPWLVFVSAGDIFEPGFLENSYLMALARKADIIYCSALGDYHTPSHFGIRAFKASNTIGSVLFVSRSLVASSNGFGTSKDSSQAVWDFVASAIVRTHAKVKPADAGLSSTLVSSTSYEEIRSENLEFKGLSPVMAYLWMYCRPFAKIVMRVWSTLRVTPVATLFKVTYANLALPRNLPGRIKVSVLLSYLIRFQVRSLRKALVKNYDLYKFQGVIKQERQSRDIVFNQAELPVFINCRDRVSDLTRVVDWLLSCGIERICLVDNDSSYPELLKYYQTTSCQVLPLGRNGGHKAPWESLAISILAKNSYYIVTDPDVIPIKDCPHDAVERFYKLLTSHKNFLKAGFGLRIDDLPEHYQLKDTVMKWESQFWNKEVESNVYDAAIDTTFALYRPNLWYCLEPGLRTGYPYVAQHTPWYQNSKQATEEDSYYRAHASKAVNTWNMDDIPDHFKEAIAQSESL